MTYAPEILRVVEWHHDPAFNFSHGVFISRGRRALVSQALRRLFAEAGLTDSRLIESRDLNTGLVIMFPAIGAQWHPASRTPQAMLEYINGLIQEHTMQFGPNGKPPNLH